MKIFDKIKNILFEEEEDLPVISENEKAKSVPEEIVNKKEPDFHRNEIPEMDLPKKKQDEFVDDVNITERDLFKSPRTFNFPLEVEDDLDNLLGRRNKNIVEISKEKDRNLDKYSLHSEEPKKTEKAPFKASPIISPVYGVMDKNYKKDDILIKSNPKIKPSQQKGIDLDNVRKKAYGTLEDDIETTLDKPLNDFYNPNNDIEIEPVKTIDDLLIDSMKDEDEKKEEVNRSFEENALNETFKLDEVIGEMKKASAELESAEDEDLFNLIDSMYSDKEDSDN